MSEERFPQESFDALRSFIASIPAVNFVAGEMKADGNWWLKLGLDIDHRLAWGAVQELGFVFNYISLNERLPTVFMPVSPPPYLNGGPRQFLSWVIETSEPIDPKYVKEVAEGRLPRPVTDEGQWVHEEDE